MPAAKKRTGVEEDEVLDFKGSPGKMQKVLDEAEEAEIDVSMHEYVHDLDTYMHMILGGEKELHDKELERLSEEAEKLLAGGTTPGSKKMYVRYQLAYQNWINANQSDTLSDKVIIDYLMLMRKKYAPIIMWCIYLSLNTLYVSEHSIDFNHMSRVKAIM